MDSTESLALFGTTQAVSPARRLAAGALSCEFSDGGLRDARWGDVEIVRGISYLFRDRDWGTAPASVHELLVDESDDSFSLRFELRVATPAGVLHADARVHGRSDGHLSFEVEATTNAALETNRCGFVVLHPASAAGRPLSVQHTDGRVSETQFPHAISPSQPVLDIRCLSYSPADGLELQCRLEAQLPHDPAGKFEMEDQRNWSDASFKTYVASLFDAWPYVLPAGQPLKQAVSVRVNGKPHVRPQAIEAAPITIGAPGAVKMPEIGVGVPPGLHCARREEVAALRALGAAWWIVEAALDAQYLHADLAAVAAERRGLGVRVQLDMIVPDALSARDAAARAATACATASFKVDAVRLLPAAYLKSFQPTDRWPDLPPLADYVQAARARFPGVPVGGGMFTYFTELNRKRPGASELDFIGHATCPIIHAADDASVMQTMEALPHIVHSVRSLWPLLPYRLGPSSIAMRRNPYGDVPATNPRLERVALARIDPRHAARFGAAWTVGYAAAVNPFGLEMLALHDSHGPRGPVPTHPSGDDASCNAPVPAWNVLARLARAAGARVVPLENLPPQIAGLAWSSDGKTIEGLVANLGREPRRLRWHQAVSAGSREPATEITLGAFETSEFANQLTQFDPEPT